MWPEPGRTATLSSSSFLLRPRGCQSFCYSVVLPTMEAKRSNVAGMPHTIRTLGRLHSARATCCLRQIQNPPCACTVYGSLMGIRGKLSALVQPRQSGDASIVASTRRCAPASSSSDASGSLPLRAELSATVSRQAATTRASSSATLRRFPGLPACGSRIGRVGRWLSPLAAGWQLTRMQRCAGAMGHCRGHRLHGGLYSRLASIDMRYTSDDELMHASASI